MTLGIRLGLYGAGLAAAVVVLAGVALGALWGLDRKLSAALGEYERLRWAYQAGVEVVRAREALLAAPPERVGVAIAQAGVWVESAKPQAGVGTRDGNGGDEAVRERVAWRLRAAGAAWSGGGEGARERALGEVHAAMNTLSAASQDVRDRIIALNDAAAAQGRRAIVAVAAITGLLCAAMGVAGVRQYRAIMRPVRRLREGTRRLASGGWDERLPVAGDRELAAVAADFNRMAERLAEAYHGLEEKVRLRSEQLVRSDRLASVGLLAAGIAHEINNPVAIIAGQAELMLRCAKPQAGGETRGETDGCAKPQAAEEGLRIIVEESFRCKEITGKLLALSRPGSAERRDVDVAGVLRAVMDAVAGLAERAGCRLRLNVPEGERLVVRADEAELRQVAVNLLLNAIGAVEAGRGFVEVSAGADERSVAVTVTDNGAGMDAATLARVFEPFFTTRDEPSRPGHGLGLTVSHAIAASHGGALSATSDGPGHGSTFTLRLPRAAAALEETP